MSVTLVTSHGKLKFEIYCEDCPVTSKNFLALCSSGFYNNCLFHRIIPGFIVQGGDPSGTGKKSESIYGKHFQDEIHDHLMHDSRGVLSMANSGPNTNGSQFFILFQKQNHLNGTNTVFGRLIDGFETLDLIEREPIGEHNKPLNKVFIHSVIIHANPIAENESI